MDLWSPCGVHVESVGQGKVQPTTPTLVLGPPKKHHQLESDSTMPQIIFP